MTKTTPKYARLPYRKTPAGQAERYVKRRNTTKVLRTVLECAILLFGLCALLWRYVFPTVYTPFDPSIVSVEDNGFICISYFGVEKYQSGSKSLIYDARLREHINALTRSGYVTITQQDVLDYYKNGKSLPAKALLLVFEDGRRDTAVFAQEIMKDVNYKATAMTYADKFEKEDSKFLNANDLKLLESNSFWELGSNGYRLEYINVFDRYGNYYGHLYANEFVRVSPYLVRDYNHYLMDFIADQDRLHTETPEEMQARIQADYDSMEYIYTSKVGYFPKMYILMHSNTGQFGTDDQVSAENEKHIRRLFQMNFNREGSCFNTRNSSIYDLTRMQPQANWYSNHLLMRVADDTKHSVSFVTGDNAEAANWSVTEGVAEYRKNAYVLTSEPDGYGRMTLNSRNYQNVRVSLSFDGNILGNQGMILRADSSLRNGVYIGIENNQFVVRDLINGASSDLFTLDLFAFDGGATKSVEEDELEGLIAKEEAILQFNNDYESLQNAQSNLSEWKSASVQTLEEGGEGYVPTFDLLDKGHRKVELLLVGDSLTVNIDGKPAVTNLKVAAKGAGTIGFESSALIQERYSQRNLYDDVYDAVFTDVIVTDPLAEEKDATVYYSYQLNGLEKAWGAVTSAFEAVANFFVENL